MHESLNRNDQNEQFSNQWDTLSENKKERKIAIKVIELGNTFVIGDKQLKEMSETLNSTIMPISSDAVERLAKYTTTLSPNEDPETIRDELYRSEYNARELASQEKQTETILSQDERIETHNQGQYYNWVNINNGHNLGCQSRFYIAPTPENTHALIRELAQTFSNHGTEVEFKYMLSTTAQPNHCDRIIIYNGFGKKEEIENIIHDIYIAKPELFEKAERSPLWIGDTSVPGVYLAPETPGYSYSNRAAQAIKTAKTISDYLRANMPTSSQQDGKELLKVLIPSMMLRYGLFAINDGGTIYFLTKMKDGSPGRFKQEISEAECSQPNGELTLIGKLENENDNYHAYDKWYKVTFSQTREGKEALINNFYDFNLQNDTAIPGMTKTIY
ncbi:hypothetical protein IJS18_02450 [Candidatus Saccharibacteria bacterium]|nr:hypothetical protein [Candidatus Saccharibacteria bacterium]